MDPPGLPGNFIWSFSYSSFLPDMVPTEPPTCSHSSGHNSIYTITFFPS